LHTTYFTLISGKSDNLLLQSYELHGAPKNGISEASNYIEVKTGDLPYKFEQVIAPGLRGMIDLSHDIYDKGNIKGEFYKNEPVLSLKSCGQTKTLSNFNTDGTPPSYFTLKKIDFGTMGKGEISSFVDVDQKIKEKADKQKQLEDLDIDYYEANRKALEAEIRINNKRIAELTREIEALSGTSEKKLRDQLVRTAKRIKDTIGKRKQTTEWFENFTNGVEKLNKIV